MGLLDFLLDILSYDGKKDKNKKLEEEMELHGLDEEEKELVRRGEQDIEDFDDEDDLEDGDYYKDEYGMLAIDDEKAEIPFCAPAP